VIVGGGPGGLAAALVLSTVQKPLSEAADDSNNSNSNSNCLFDKIVVVDEAPKEAYDPTRAYFFNINRRGQTFTNAVGIDLSDWGTGVTEFAKFTVPADPAEVFEGTQPFSRPMSPHEQENIGTLYWIPRHELVELITDAIQSRQQQKKDNCGGAVIEFRRNARCHHIEPTEDGSQVKLVLLEGKGDTGAGKTDDDNNEQDDGGKSVKAFFQKAHPRYDWERIVADDEWALFAATEGVVLIGDALHSFPPDTGQGVNAALCDVMALKASFEEAARVRSRSLVEAAAPAAVLPPSPITTTTPKTKAGAAVAEARSASASTSPKSNANSTTSAIPSTSTTTPPIVTPNTKVAEVGAIKRQCTIRILHYVPGGTRTRSMAFTIPSEALRLEGGTTVE